MSVEPNENAATRDLRAFDALRTDDPSPLPGLPGVHHMLAETGTAASPSLLFGHTRELDPTATMRTNAPVAMTPRTRRDMEIWVPEASQLPLLSLARTPGVEIVSSVIISDDLPREIPDLTLTGVLGAGGSGQVLLAYQQSMGREVAVKVPRDSEPWFAPTLLAEGRLAGRIEHPNVIPIYALGRSEQGAPVLVMKRMRGATWEALMSDPNHPVWERFKKGDEKPDYLEYNLTILLAVVQGISAAHRGGVIHRDVKPANVLVAGPDEICVIDWGLALDLRDPRGATALVGTPAFMAPEMLGPRDAVGGGVGERTDVYELGATLHFILSGRHRNPGATTDAILEGLRSPSTVDLPNAPIALAHIVRRATAFDPRERHATAAAFGEAIRDWLEQRSAERVARSADERLDQLATALSDYRAIGDPQRREARAHLDRLASACRASIEDALALVPDLAMANSARLRYLELWVSHLLERGDTEAARAELGAAPGFVPELELRLTRLEADQAARMSRLSSLEHEFDLQHGAFARRRFFVVALMFSVLMVILYVALLPELATNDNYRRFGPLISIFGTNVFFWVILWRWRKHLLLNAVNRNIMAWLAVTLGSLIAHRVGVLVSGDADVARTFTNESLVATVLSAYASVTITRKFWPAPFVSLVAYGVSLAMPEQSPLIFGILMAVLMGIATYTWGRNGRSAHR